MTVPLSSWRRLPTGFGSAAYHIAQSDALARHSFFPTVWWHVADRPALIIGAGQSLRDIDEAACRAAGIQIVRRTSGGTAVYASMDLVGLDIALPIDCPLVHRDLVKSYEWFGETWAHALRRFDIEVRTVGVDVARENTRNVHLGLVGAAAACFGSLSPHEVVYRDRKLVGLSQVRRRNTQVLQAGCYLRFSASELVPLLHSPDRQRMALALDSAATGLREIVGRTVTFLEVQSAFEAALRDRTGVELHDDGWTVDELQHTHTRPNAGGATQYAV